uniref:GG19599 n=2 Tax=Drosophila erecta TaxID=7220 RepID=B3P156_DROER
MLDLTKKDILLKPLAERNITPHHNSTELMVLREQFKPCDQVISLKRDEYSMLKDGAMFLHKSAQTLSNDQYCLYPEIYSDFPETIWVINRKCFKNNSAELTMISVVCYILTLAVYLSVKKLRNLLGKCLICTIFCLFIENFIWTLDHFRLVFDICAATGYIQYYFTISSYLWLSVVSFQLWEVLTSLKREEPQYRFLIYNTVVWCTAAIPTGVIVSMNQIRENNPEKSRSLPHDGYTGCSDTDMSNCYTPLIITDIFNATMFVLTSIHIWKVKREVKRFAQQDIRSSTCFEFDFQTYIQFLRLFMIMGANWIIYQLTEIVDFMKSSIIKSLTVYIQDSFGIILFVLLILKSSTLKVIMER